MSSPDPHLIAVIGPTGAGKSTFINLVGKVSQKVGYGLESCTEKIQAVSVDGMNVVLLDTPGFGDTNKEDVDILDDIVDYMKKMYKNGRMLSGILYFHPIDGRRLDGIAFRKLRPLESLCGKDPSKYVFVVTNMWGLLSNDLKTGDDREKELKQKDKYFKTIVNEGATFVKHHDTEESAREIIQQVLDKRPAPPPASMPMTPPLKSERKPARKVTPGTFAIQSEMVDDCRPLDQTSAGAQLIQASNALLDKLKQKEGDSMEQSEAQKTINQPTISSSMPNESIILVLGPTGAGKSTFINDASGSEEMKVWQELEGCTKKVVSTKPFLIDDKSVVLIDTPGLNNDEDKDIQEIFEDVETLLQMKHQGKRLQGIIYIHAVDVRHSEGIEESEIKKVCRVPFKEPKSSFIVATTRWDTAKLDQAIKWEERLKNEDILFKPFADRGVKFVRHPGSGSPKDSAREIVRFLLNSTETINLRAFIRGNRFEHTPGRGRGRGRGRGSRRAHILQLIRLLFGPVEP